jgi:hypothetical protein
VGCQSMRPHRRGGDPSAATTLAVAGGYVATGTDKGELLVHNLRSSKDGGGGGSGSDVDASPGAAAVTPVYSGCVTARSEVLNNLGIVCPANGALPCDGALWLWWLCLRTAAMTLSMTASARLCLSAQGPLRLASGQLDRTKQAC